MINETVRRVSDAWFSPKPFENEQLYEKLGIRTFKKYMPTSGDLVMRHVWRKTRKVRGIESLRRLERGTRFPEKLHLVGLFAFPIVGVLVDQIGWANAINVFFNIYPIMLQRYNRIRYQGALRRMEERERLTSAYQS